MKIRLETKVAGNYLKVMDRFDLDLFNALKPKGANMEVVKFTGSKKGDVVEIQFHSPIKTKWISNITEDGSDDSMAYFIDEGSVLPFPIKKWKHKHIVEKINEDESLIVDDIYFSTGFILFDVLIYPGVLLGFLPRKKVYRGYFGSV